MRSSKMTFICDACNREIKRGESMVVLAKVPQKSYVGRTETLIHKWVEGEGGIMYCGCCFEQNYKVLS